MNSIGIKMYRCAQKDSTAFQCFLYTNEWGIVECSEISHRVAMQPVMKHDMHGFFWMNEQT